MGDVVLIRPHPRISEHLWPDQIPLGQAISVAMWHHDWLEEWQKMLMRHDSQGFDLYA